MMVPTAIIPIYRLIHIDNLPIYLQRGGMHAPNNVPNDGLEYRTIHNIEIQRERHKRPIPCGSKGTLHDYLPFYFGYLSPMLLQLCTGRVEEYDGGPSPLIYIVSSVQRIVISGLSFVFSDGHGIAAFTDWFDDMSQLIKVDWEVVNARYWSDTLTDPDRQRRKQAEFLVFQFCPWDVILEIGVYDSGTKNQVEGIMNKYGAITPVQVRRQWYY